ncbi:MAG: hypothetical protein J7L15_00925 [Clostridiales bacterium]|nr:hypothetical protein [Clostridiales bacterium]
MKTPKQIKNKIDTLKTKLQKKQIVENFGDKEQIKLKVYIGYIWDYDYSDRMVISYLTKQFFEWCYNYTGEQYAVRKR